MIAPWIALGLDGRRVRDVADGPRWIAANALAIRGVELVTVGQLPTGAVTVRAPTLVHFLAALASGPAAVDGRSLPRSWRLALAALGIPLSSTGPVLLRRARRGEDVAVDVMRSGDAMVVVVKPARRRFAA